MIRPSGPLSGIRVVDLTLALAGPAATQRMGDWGADVIKVEPVVGGEWTRTRSIVNAWLAGETTVFLSLNRNKRSIAIDLKSTEGREIVLRLVDTADVFIHNFRPGVAGRLGLAASDVRCRNPQIVYASASGYGQDGPDARRPGQDLLLQAYAGTMFSVGAADDPPRPGAIYVADVLTSHLLLEGILAALMERARTNEGQEVHVSMLGAMLDAQLQELVTFLNLGIAPKRDAYPTGHALLNPPYGVHRTADGWIAIAMAEPKALGRALGSDAIEALGTWEEAARSRALVYGECARILPERPTAEWLDRFDQAGVWAGPVHTYDDLRNHPQIAAAGLINEIPLPDGSTFLAPDNAVQFSSHTDLVRFAPPTHSQHANEILSELGIPSEQRSELASRGVIALPESKRTE